MIGIKVKNSDWEKALLALLKGRAEIWRPHKSYHLTLKERGGRSAEKVLIVSSHSKQSCLRLPFKIKDLDLLLAQFPVFYENDFFKWDSQHRQLEDKKNNQKIRLTEKEAAIIDFLCLSPRCEASKEELLKQVWNYSGKAETHTVETTICGLKQKLKKSAKLLTSTEKGYKLI
ncbi:MAG: winged helix-turn-helix domain-containing protein [Alphaproteobacteria bacterium]